MASKSGRFVFAILVLAGSAASAQAQFGDNNPDQQSQPVVLASIAGPDVFRGTSNAQTSQGTPLLIAAVPLTHNFGFDGAERSRGFASTGAPAQVKSWMLIALGAFLILAIGQRRYQSMLD